MKQTVEMAVVWEPKKRCKMMELRVGDIVVGSTFQSWTEFASLFLRCLAYPDDWLTTDWHPIGSPPGDEAIVFAVKRDERMWGKVVRMGLPERPIMLNYVLCAQVVGLLAAGLAYPDDQLSGRQVVGTLEIETGDPVAGGAGSNVRILPFPERASLKGAVP